MLQVYSCLICNLVLSNLLGRSSTVLSLYQSGLSKVNPKPAGRAPIFSSTVDKKILLPKELILVIFHISPKNQDKHLRREKKESKNIEL